MYILVTRMILVVVGVVCEGEYFDHVGGFGGAACREGEYFGHAGGVGAGCRVGG